MPIYGLMASQISTSPWVDGDPPRMRLKSHFHDLFVKVGSFYPKRENLRLTPEVKEKSTGKLALNPRDFSVAR